MTVKFVKRRPAVVRANADKAYSEAVYFVEVLGIENHSPPRQIGNRHRAVDRFDAAVRHHVITYQFHFRLA